MSLVAAIVLLACSQTKPSRFQTVCPHPTGRNGYEEYLQAADCAQAPAFRAARTAYDAAIAAGRPCLDEARQMVRLSGSIQQLVKVGNRKPVSDPRVDMDNSTVFTEYAAFKDIAKYLESAANVDFAEGRPRQGAETLTDGIVFAERLMNTGVLITYLVGAAEQSIQLRGFANHLSEIPVAEDRSIASLCDAWIGQNPLAGTFAKETRYTSKALADMIQNPSSISDWGVDEDGSLSALSQEVQKLGPAGRAQLLKEMTDKMADYSHRIIAVLGSPEPEWPQLVPKLIGEDPGRAGSLATRLCQLVLPVYGQVFAAELKRRTQLRLLRLHLLVEAKRLETGVLPTSLAELNDQNLVRDPVNGREFVYVPRGRYYELYSLGNGLINRMDLVYKASAAADSASPQVTIRP